MRSPASAIEQLRALVERDTSLQERLCQPDDPALFVALVVEAARDHGLSLDAAEIDAAISANRRASADEGGARLPPRGWLPVQAGWRDRELRVHWAYLGSRRLLEPFFEDTVRHCLTKPFNRLFGYSTPIDALAGWLRDHPGLPPTGFIFHMSRCGSTLVSQMLAAIPRNIVVSEASPIDVVVQARRNRPDLGNEQHAAWLRWMIGALGQARSGEERHFFVKLDSWHALALPLFRRAFPTVPWIFLYRDPLEILVSQFRRRGMHMVPGLLGQEVFGFETSQSTGRPEIYGAQVLARIYDGVLQEYAPGRALLVNYQELPAALWTDVLPHFGVPCDADDRAAMAEAARYDAKSPERPFADDTAAKRRAATDQIRSAAQQLAGLHARLEALRLGGLTARDRDRIGSGRD
jgi:hypothetical protein